MQTTADYQLQLVNPGGRTDTLQVLKGDNCQLRLLYPAKLSITAEGKIKISHGKNKL